MSQPWGRTTSFFDGWSNQNAASVAAAPEPTGTPEPAGPEKRSRRPWTLAALGAVLVAGAATTWVALPSGSAQADPSANTWHRLRVCESSNNYSTNTGNGHYGAYQFDLSTWRSVGGSGYPNRATPAEQDARALILYRERGWQPWQCASILGLREDSDARSGRISDINVSTGTSTGSSARIPAFPGGSYWYRYGDVSRNIKTFQDRMHARGYFPVGTGQYGPNTLRLIEQLQRLNGLIPNGYLGPKTWRLAWTGRYTPPAASKPVSKPVPKPPVKSTSIPAFPGGSYWYRYGDVSRNIKTFQDRMHARGYFPVGTGQYGPNTLRMIEQLQRLNGLIPNGYLGPKTWRLAWTGKYHT
jgi:peptidoglycan hydrolase-like protein with peptidoglycan-binding domain